MLLNISVVSTVKWKIQQQYAPHTANPGVVERRRPESEFKLSGTKLALWKHTVLALCLLKRIPMTVWIPANWRS